ncbi:hypothetical protein [Nocardia transvalensis]|uniref:hypothetical protein n=1 Tax=Nocardia transvalensis TaxID=37333 RepID=UPI00189349DE|nr:hypothetical protein [Nocardia transvalensis]MBF6331816.1 hypothetical protein [Nocardia transvalensis]
MNRRIRLISAIGATTVIALLGSCGHSHDRASKPEPRCNSTLFAPRDQVDHCSAEAVMTAAASTVFSYRPASEPDPRDAFRQAKPLMDPDYARRAEPAAGVLVPITGTMWAQWASAGTTITATARVTGDDHPPDTGTRAARVLDVTQQPSDNTPPIRFALYVEAERPNEAAGWRISAMEVKQ